MHFCVCRNSRWNINSHIFYVIKECHHNVIVFLCWHWQNRGQKDNWTYTNCEKPKSMILTKHNFRATSPLRALILQIVFFKVFLNALPQKVTCRRHKFCRSKIPPRLSEWRTTFQAGGRYSLLDTRSGWPGSPRLPRSCQTSGSFPSATVHVWTLCISTGVARQLVQKSEWHNYY